MAEEKKETLPTTPPFRQVTKRKRREKKSQERKEKVKGKKEAQAATPFPSIP